MSQEELKEEQRLALWGKFFSAKSDEEVEAVAKEDPMIKEAKDILAQLSAKPSAQEMVRQREHAMRMYNFELAAAKEEGMDIGEAKGKAEGKAEDALNMLKDGLPIEKVHAYTGLSLEKIQELIKQMSH
jgi:predicted transposase/invertase (TIGR01784 family)